MSLSVNQSLNKAKRHIKKGETDLAAQLYKSILEKSPQNKRAIAGLSALQQPKEVKTTTDAEPTQQKISRLIVLYNQGKFQQALDDGEALEKQFPNMPFIPNLLGAVNDALGRFERAVASYTKALQIKPNYAEAHNNLGITFRVLGKQDEAIASFNKALEIKPNFAEAHNNLGITFRVLGKQDEAIASYNKALQIKPDFAEAHKGK